MALTADQALWARRQVVADVFGAAPVTVTKAQIDWLATIDGGRPAWNIELVLTFPAGPLTVPPDRPDTISVRASLDTD